MLEAGETSAARVLQLTVPSGVQRFRVEAGGLSTDWPQLPLVIGSMYALLDSTKFVDSNEDNPESAVFSRTDIRIRFEPHVSDLEKAAFFARHSITVLAQTLSDRFYVRMPDPGLTIEEYRAAVDVLRAQPETRYVVPISHPEYGWIPVRSSRFRSGGRAEGG